MYIKVTAESFPVNGVKRLRFDGVTEMTENQTTADKFEAEQRGWEEGGGGADNQPVGALCNLCQKTYKTGPSHLR